MTSKFSKSELLYLVGKPAKNQLVQFISSCIAGAARMR
ncbi:hypothetical protein HNP72_002253 [Sphingobacterium soli]|nr:hypothetical protein [Sphingobacterium soli]